LKVRHEIGITFDQEKFKSLPKEKMEEMSASLKENHGGYCIVCYSSFSDADNDPTCKPLSLECGHEFCVGCWKENLKELVVNGAHKSLKTPCPQSGCNLLVPHSIFQSLFSSKNSEDSVILKKYMRWHCQSFTDDNKDVKWCPFTKDCEYAA